MRRPAGRGRFGGGRGRGRGGGGGVDGGRGGGRGSGRRGGKGRGGRGGLKSGSKVVVEPHRHAGVFVAKDKEDALCTSNMVLGESVYGEKRINVQNEDGTKTECRVWNPFRSKLAAAVLGGVDDIWIVWPDQDIGLKCWLLLEKWRKLCDIYQGELHRLYYACRVSFCSSGQDAARKAIQAGRAGHSRALRTGPRLRCWRIPYSEEMEGCSSILVVLVLCARELGQFSSIFSKIER